MSNGLSKSAIWGEKEGDVFKMEHDADTATTVTYRYRDFSNGDQKLLLVVLRHDGVIHYEHEFDTGGEDSAEVIANAKSHARKIITRDFKPVN